MSTAEHAALVSGCIAAATFVAVSRSCYSTDVTRIQHHPTELTVCMRLCNPQTACDA